jgi:hypothetical protein
MDRKSILAKLLATENVSIQYGNYSTASFDLESRTLHIPQWDFDCKGLLDLLISHEVGHALWTPTAGWHSAKDDVPGIPRSYINIIEDIRIEKLIQRKYPGLVRSFKLGYTELLNRDFFGLKGQDIAAMSFMNRVNVKSKARDLMEVPFYGDEVELFAECLAVETWEDVLEVCRKLVDYAESDREEQNRQQDDSGEGEEQQMESSGSDGDQEGDESAEASGFGGEESDEEGDESDASTPDQSNEGGEYDEDKHRVETDENFRWNEESLIDTYGRGRVPTVFQIGDNSQVQHISYKTLIEDRQQTSFGWIEKYVGDFDEYRRENRGFAGLMAKEFEMRKAAKQNLRASTAKTGMIDVNKLHSYKYNDDIFARMTSIPNAKNHGLMMLIDYSGSMTEILPKVLKQTLALVSFCKKVNIPFEVYGFTGGWNGSSTENNVLDLQNLKMYHIFSSKMTRQEYETAFHQVWKQSELHYFRNQPEALGSTPLHEALAIWPKMLREFKAATKVEKVINVVMTDGHPNDIGNFSASEYALEIEGRLVKVRDNKLSKGFRLVMEQMEDIRQNIEGVINIGYFIDPNTNNLTGWANQFSTIGDGEFNSQMKINRFVNVNVKGFDAYFIMKVDRKTTGVTDKVDTTDMNLNQIKNSFKKVSKSKKTQRVLATQFAEVIG